MNNEALIQMVELIRRNKQISHKSTFSYRGMNFLESPKVFSASIFGDAIVYDGMLPNMSGKTFLEIGCGIGIISISRCKDGAIVTATDYNPHAVKLTEVNARRQKLPSEVSVLCSDVFDDVPEFEKFDFVFWNVPFVFTKNKYTDWLLRSCFDNRYLGFKKFSKGAQSVINNGGRVFFGFSKQLGDFEKLSDISQKDELKIIEIGVADMPPINGYILRVGLYELKK